MLLNELMLDIFPLFSRFELDEMKFVSRKYRGFIEATAASFSFRQFHNVDIREREIDFSIDLPCVSRNAPESRRPEVETDFSAKHRIESDPEVALQHLSHAYVQRGAIIGIPNRDMMRVLQSRELTFRVGTFVIDADLRDVEQDELRAFIRCIPGMQDFVICDSRLKPDHFSDSLLRDCASLGVEGIRNYQDRDHSPMLTGPGIREFYSIAVRGHNEPCRMDLRCGGDYTETFLLDFLEAVEARLFVDSFCLALNRVPPQRLGKYQADVRDCDSCYIEARLIIKSLNVEVAWGKRRLFINRNHALSGCNCPYRIVQTRYPELSSS